MAEKTLTQLPRDLRALVIKGQEAATRDNFDYAIALFLQVLHKEPSCFEVRKALRNTQLSRAGGRTTFFRKMFAGATTSPLLAKAQLALHNHNPTDALLLAEQMLDADPYNSQAHRLVVDAAEALELPQTALLSLELLARIAPKDKPTVIRFANALANAGQNVRAENLLSDLAREMPTDAEVSMALKNLSARRTMDEGGYDDLAEGKGSYRDILRNEGEARELEQEQRVVKTEDTAARLTAEYETRLKTDPNNPKVLRSLAELYTQKHRFDEALALYDRLRATELGSDPALVRAISQVKVRRLEHQIAQLDATAPDHAEQLATLEAEKLEFQLAETRKRVDQFPTDLALRFELGALYLQTGKIGEAIQEFQRAQGNPHKRIAAMSGLARCFAQRKMFDLAARTLQNALKEKPMMDEEKKDLLYTLGEVLEKMGRKDEAVEQLKLIYEVDIGYRDVAAKVDAYYAGQ
ncbi:MAG: tetratricopeptide repeat protein [Verrucomicrobia bacterium]|jgi:tetratricopeptide (TPR) repeat protein|nr:tetratricopeptide repeat protein [Verrucomicrobiota bacterium]